MFITPSPRWKIRKSSFIGSTSQLWNLRAQKEAELRAPTPAPPPAALGECYRWSRLGSGPVSVGLWGAVYVTESAGQMATWGRVGETSKGEIQERGGVRREHRLDSEAALGSNLSSTTSWLDATEHSTQL